MSLFKKRHPQVGARPGSLVLAPEAPPPKMAIIDYNRDGVREQADATIAQVREAIAHPGPTWVDVQGLGDESILLAIAEVIKLHPLALEDVVNAPQRPKQEQYEHNHLIIARMLQMKGEFELDYEQVSIVVGEGWVFTFQEKPGDVFDPVRKRIRDGKGAIRKLGADYLAYALLDTIVDAYYPALEQLGDQLEELEDEVMTHGSSDSLPKISAAKNTLLRMRRAVWPLRDVVNGLIRDESRFITDEVRVYLRDTHDHCMQTVDVGESYREIVGGLMNTYLTVVSNRMNEVMKVLTIMASIFIPLTFMAGIYGMNFEHMPELHSRWAYPMLLGAMVATAFGMVIFFVRKGWIGKR